MLKDLGLAAEAAMGAGAGLTPAERGQLRERVRRKRHALQGRLDLRWLDFASHPLHVVEADGRVLLERANEALDTLLAVIPSASPTSGSACPA
ncbi:hypothetical protein HLB44_32480 [Aquincola sp. S2]|uniref:DUF222 domain-containing protein n=1 Tax=Pseudaquabacterium terrae TaxID=2732868 RepID=A0ABX2ESJ0_9BURK|nr:hypothetical protein [Aquabacterium terrae]NRF71715.1 hypothetical protein [Aquabacterium terrae]